MKRTVVQSSNLLSVGYDERTLTLEIEFRDGCIYQYTRIPKQVYVELMSAEKKACTFASTFGITVCMAVLGHTRR